MVRMIPAALFSLQVFHVAFLALHDWVPLGKLNDTRAVRRENSRGKLLFATLFSTAPFAFLLWQSAQNLHGPLPRRLSIWLAVGYGLLFLGEVHAWWLPYLRGTGAETTERYRVMFGSTHAFLPQRHGITINTLHVVLHASTLATLLLLAVNAPGY